MHGEDVQDHPPEVVLVEPEPQVFRVAVSRGRARGDPVEQVVQRVELPAVVDFHEGRHGRVGSPREEVVDVRLRLPEVDGGVGDPVGEVVDLQLRGRGHAEFGELGERRPDGAVDRRGVGIGVGAEACFQHPDPPGGQRNVDVERASVAADDGGS